MMRLSHSKKEGLPKDYTVIYPEGSKTSILFTLKAHPFSLTLTLSIPSTRAKPTALTQD